MLRKKTFLLAVLVGLASLLEARGDSTSESGTCSFSATGVEESRKFCNEHIRTSLLVMPISQFCESVSKTRALEDDLDIHTKGIEDFEERLRSTGGEVIRHQPSWQLAMYPHPVTRNEALASALNTVDRSLADPKTLEKFLGTLGAVLDGYPSSNEAALRSELTLPLIHRDRIKLAELQEAYVCRNYGYASIPDCVKSIGQVLEIMSPRDDSNTLIPVIQEVFTDSAYIEPARRVGLTIFKRINSKNVPVGDLLSDIRRAFRESGVPSSRLEDMVWKFLAVTQFQGANSSSFLRPFTTKQTSPILLATAIVGAGQYILDLRRSNWDSLYSYPSTVRTHCDFGKSYHFWIGAYLSRQVSLGTKNYESASVAAWIAHLGYQMRASTGIARYPERPFLSDVFSVTNNGNRLDLAYASAGALYGAQVAKGATKVLDIDKAIHELLRHADSSLAPISIEEARQRWSGTGLSGYSRWMKLYSPDSAFNSYPH